MANRLNAHRKRGLLTGTFVYYVYALIDPRINQPFYVGKGKGKRCHAHVQDWRSGGRGGNAEKLERIGDIIGSGYDVDVQILLADVAEDEALTVETQYIKEYRARGYALTNIAGGGGQHPNSIESSLKRVSRAIERFRRPKEWKLWYLRAHGRLPRAADWDTFLAVYDEHVSLRDDLKAKLVKLNAAKKKAAAA